MSTEGNLLERFLSTDRNSVLLLQRILLALVIFPHGAQKALGWFGGFGFDGTMGFFTDTMHIPSPVAFLVIVAEFVGPLGLLLGAGTRLAALGVSAVMLGAILTTHAQFGFFMNWFGSQPGEGYEYHVLALALSVPLVIRGGGLLSLDALLAQRLRPQGSLSQMSQIGL